MWEENTPSSAANDSHAHGDAAPSREADRTVARLESEWRRARRDLAYHPAITLTPLRGDPPYEFQVDYRVRTLATNEAEELAYVDSASMHLWLPPEFPNEAPVIRPMTNIFHPNITYDGVSLSQPWHASETLVDFLGRIGELLAYRTHDRRSVVNQVAMDWLLENSTLAPLDSRADFFRDAGGDPLTRIIESGPATLEEIRRSLDDTRAALLAPDGEVTPLAIQEFSRKTRGVVSLFLESDIPENLRQTAQEFDEWCRDLPSSVPQWEHLRRQRTRGEEIAQATSAAVESSAALQAALKDLDGLIPMPLPTAPVAAAQAIPPMSQLQDLQLKLPILTREFESKHEALRGLLDGLNQTSPPATHSLQGSLGRRLANQAEAVADFVAAAAAAAQAFLDQAAPLIARARPESTALEQAVGWREYIDMFTKARTIEKQLADWGSAGVHAFYLTNSSGSFGPFQYEEPVDLGGPRFVMRNLQGSQIELIDCATQAVAAKVASGPLTLAPGKTPGGIKTATTFSPTARCDDVLIQLDFIQSQTSDLLLRLPKSIEGATSWAGAVSRVFSDQRNLQNLRDAHRKVSHKWKGLSVDLNALLKFKQRVATYNLLKRLIADVPAFKTVIAGSQRRFDEVTDRIQAILGKSSRDPLTGQTAIPPKFVEQYQVDLQKREDIKQELSRQQGQLKQLARDVFARLSNPALLGRPEAPTMRVLAALPLGLKDLEKSLSDVAIKKLVGELEEKIGIRLTPAAPAQPPQPPAGAAAPSRPAQPNLPNAAAVNAFPRQADADAKPPSGRPAMPKPMPSTVGSTSDAAKPAGN